MKLKYDYDNNCTIAMLTIKEFTICYRNWLIDKGFDINNPIKENCTYIYFKAKGIIM